MSDEKRSGGSAASPMARARDAFRGKALVPLILAGSAFAAAVIALLMWASTPEYRVLFSNLSEGDGGRIINELDARQIPYRFGSGGAAIMVPGDQVHRLRLQLAEQGLPRGGNVGFELMDQQDFGISQFSEQVNFQRSMEGELARSISAMDPVVKARVHLSMAKPSVFVRDSEPAKGSIVVTLHPGRSLSQGQVEAIVHLVSSSVPKLNADKVTVVDQGGNLLSARDTAQTVRVEHLGFTSELEQRHQRRIEQILKPLYGAQNIRVQVAADLDFSQREETIERFQPNQSENEAAIRSTQLSGSLRGSKELAEGIPGALSNTPPGWQPSPVNEEEEEQAGQASENQEAERGQLSYDNVVNYEVDRNISHVRHSQGQVQRLTVAVVINHRSAVDEEGEPIQLPLEADELDEVRRLVSQAMGYSEARGDQLEIVNRPFASDFVAENAEEETKWWEQAGMQQLLLSLGRWLLAGLFALLLYALLLRPFLKRYLESGPTAAAGPAVVRSAAVSASTVAAEVDDMGDGDIPRPVRKRRASSYEDDLKGVRELAKEDPRLVAMVVRSWMNKDEK